MLENLKQQVYDANMQLADSGLVILTWGNVSSRTENDLVVIKPSGVQYSKMKPADMVVVDMDGNIVDGNLKPSSDLLTHIEIYKASESVRGVCHTHSSFATSFAQAGMSIDALGTTHADYFYGAVPCTRDLTEEEVKSEYEKNTGKVIVEEFKNKDYVSIPGVLVKSHGVFSWGRTAAKAVENAIVIEKIAKMNFQTMSLNRNARPLQGYVLDKHYYRKHGANAYYGQEGVFCARH